jgi:PRP38 family
VPYVYVCDALVWKKVSVYLLHVPSHSVGLPLLVACSGVEPWIPKTRTPSTCICLLYKLFTLKLSEKQMIGMLDNKNEYIRGIGFLYLRLCYDPAGMLEWFYDYLEDEAPIQPNERGKEM